MDESSAIQNNHPTVSAPSERPSPSLSFSLSLSHSLSLALPPSRSLPLSRSSRNVSPKRLPPHTLLHTDPVVLFANLHPKRRLQPSPPITTTAVTDGHRTPRGETRIVQKVGILRSLFLLISLFFCPSSLLPFPLRWSAPLSPQIH